MTFLFAAFQFWDSVQALSSYIRGMFSSQAILKGVGVGSQVCAFVRPSDIGRMLSWRHSDCQQAATPLSAVFQFFLRDLTGMLGGMLFAFWQVRSGRIILAALKRHCMSIGLH